MRFLLVSFPPSDLGTVAVVPVVPPVVGVVIVPPVVAVLPLLPLAWGSIPDPLMRT